MAIGDFAILEVHRVQEKGKKERHRTGKTIVRTERDEKIVDAVCLFQLEGVSGVPDCRPIQGQTLL